MKQSCVSTFGAFFFLLLVAAALVVEGRNFQKGVATHTVQSCDALEPHSSSSWWYSWATTSGFTGIKGSFCDDPDTSATNARASGMEFVPMFWESVPVAPFDAETTANLEAANYLLTFNEPEIDFQANLTALQGALMWPEIEAIASAYNLQLVAPCTTGDKGLKWYDEWLGNCTALGYTCNFDYTCVHLYYQPVDDDTGSCGADVEDWACIGNQAIKASNRIDEWYDKYGNKPTWVTEWACAPWGATSACDGDKHSAIMQQLLPILHDNPKVYRYSWYSLADLRWVSNSLNELTWEGHPKKECPTMKWVGGFGTASWQIQTLHECVAKAEAEATCAHPLSLSMDGTNCYCATDSCSDLGDSYDSMYTYKEVRPRDANSTLTPLGEYYNSYDTTTTTTAAAPLTTTTTTSSSTFSTISTTTTNTATTTAAVTTIAEPVCLAEGDGLGCNEQTNCCAGIGECSTGGNPIRRVCLAPSGTGRCGGNRRRCSLNADCCSNNCSGGYCKGNGRRLGVSHVTSRH